jgi:tetratricopeptide (TPR) repeat protein
MRTRRPLRLAAFVAGLACAWLAGASALADVDGIITKQDDTRLQGAIRWLPASKEYVVTRGNLSLRVALAQVRGVQVAKPAALDGALQMVRAGQYAAAIQPLEQIMKDYAMLEHDVTAAASLATAYLKMKQAAKAVEMCEVVIKVNPAAGVSGDLANVYWDALLEAGREATLKAQLGEAVKSGNRAVAARAQLKRGDIDMKNGKFQDALVDGFLRTAILFGDVKEVQPEALYKAMKCFEQLQQVSHAEKMRKKLLAEFPDDRYSQELKAGS